MCFRKTSLSNWQQIVVNAIFLCARICLGVCTFSDRYELQYPHRQAFRYIFFKNVFIPLTIITTEYQCLPRIVRAPLGFSFKIIRTKHLFQVKIVGLHINVQRQSLPSCSLLSFSFICIHVSNSDNFNTVRLSILRTISLSISYNARASDKAFSRVGQLRRIRDLKGWGSAVLASNVALSYMIVPSPPVLCAIIGSHE